MSHASRLSVRLAWLGIALDDLTTEISESLLQAGDEHHFTVPRAHLSLALSRLDQSIDELEISQASSKVAA